MTMMSDRLIKPRRVSLNFGFLTGANAIEASATKAAKHLSTDDLRSRIKLFDALGRFSDNNVFCVETAHEKFLINLRDQVIGKSIFIYRTPQDFDKLLVVLDLLKTRGVFPNALLDVGANIGAICIPAVARGLVERAVAFEPHPLNCTLLQANIALNNVRRQITIVEAAVGASEGGTVELTLSAENWGDHRVLYPTEQAASVASREKIAVPVVRLDTWRDLDGALVWMDIQGYEGHALKGATKLLSRAPPLVLEFWPEGMEVAQSFDALRSAIAHYEGFYDLESPDRLRPVDELTSLRDELETRSKGSFTDILVV
jgi:FkbM family methyltransferase